MGRKEEALCNLSNLPRDEQQTVWPFFERITNAIPRPRPDIEVGSCPIELIPFLDREKLELRHIFPFGPLDQEVEMVAGWLSFTFDRDSGGKQLPMPIVGGLAVDSSAQPLDELTGYGFIGVAIARHHHASILTLHERPHGIDIGADHFFDVTRSYIDLIIVGLRIGSHDLFMYEYGEGPH